MALSFSMEHTIDASQERVFTALTDVAGFGDWMPGHVDSTVLTEGAFGVGAEYEETRRMFRRNATERFRVTSFEPPREFELFIDGSQGSSRSGYYRFRYVLTPQNSATLVTVHGEVGGMNRIMALLGRLMLPTMKKAMRKDHAALAAHLEATPDSQ